MMIQVYTYAALFSLSILSSTANAALIYSNDNRFISHSIDGTFTPSTPYADFRESWYAYDAGAYQNTILKNSAMSGSGSTVATIDVMNYGVEVISRFDVNFSVNQITDFSLKGSLETSGDSDGDLYVSLLENGTEIFGLDMLDLTTNGSNPFNFAGQFSTGSTYQLILQSNMYDSNFYNETWNFSLSTAPAAVSTVPVPAAVWLFASGLFSLLMVTKRNSRA